MDIEKQAYDLMRAIIEDADGRFNLKAYGRIDFGNDVKFSFVCKVGAEWYMWDFTYSHQALSGAITEDVLLERPFEYNRQLAEIRSSRERS